MRSTHNAFGMSNERQVSECNKYLCYGICSAADDDVAAYACGCWTTECRTGKTMHEYAKCMNEWNKMNYEHC